MVQQQLITFTYTVRDHNRGDDRPATWTITITGSNNTPPVDAEWHQMNRIHLEDANITVTGSAVT